MTENNANNFFLLGGSIFLTRQSGHPLQRLLVVHWRVVVAKVEQRIVVEGREDWTLLVLISSRWEVQQAGEVVAGLVRCGGLLFALALLGLVSEIGVEEEFAAR